MSKKIMEINEVIEVIDNEVKEKTAKHPKPIKLYATEDVIEMVALTETSYEKRYFTSKEMDSSPRRVKVVKLPVSHDKIKFTKVQELFKYLLDNKGYLPL